MELSVECDVQQTRI